MGGQEAIFGGSRAPKSQDQGWGSAVGGRSGAPPRDFLQKVSAFKGLARPTILQRSSLVVFNTPCCARGGGSRTPCGRNTAAPSQGCSACGLWQATVAEMCDTMVSEVVREFLGFPLGCRRFFVGPLLAALGPLLGHSWAALGRSWVALGPLWGALGLLLRVSWPLLGLS